MTVSVEIKYWGERASFIFQTGVYKWNFIWRVRLAYVKVYRIEKKQLSNKGK